MKNHFILFTKEIKEKQLVQLHKLKVNDKHNPEIM